MNSSRGGAERSTRANGQLSRRKILDAAREIAATRGFSGTSIGEVSKRSGLPNSSIYWHFEDKDALFAAVIEDSYEQWRADFDARARSLPTNPGDELVALHESLATFPAFLRFGHLVILEQHDTELSARKAFLRIRRESLKDLAEVFGAMTGCSEATANEFAALALALIDGAFLARAAGERTLDLSDPLRNVFDAYVRSALTR